MWNVLVPFYSSGTNEGKKGVEKRIKWKESSVQEKGKGLLATPSSLFNLGGFRIWGKVEFAELKQESPSKAFLYFKVPAGSDKPHPLDNMNWWPTQTNDNGSSLFFVVA
ncbi:hypothetical protein AVEN_245479-1 [Araneus ventricosus]|uniref:Uncharacterized protein n=1 Tax=Araneus ventricosus TaxID=182803 RepID=A0A4Y2D5T4_ARAVE|nr:hypothetical protein AVEN_245479-1 [Araneus ventricosus]